MSCHRDTREKQAGCEGANKRCMSSISMWKMHHCRKYISVMNKAVRKWLGVTRCLYTVVFHLDLPMTSLVEAFKYAKTSLDMTVTQSKDPVAKNTAPMVKTGKKWFNMHKAHYKHRDIFGQVESGRAGFGLGTGGVRLLCRTGSRW